MPSAVATGIAVDSGELSQEAPEEDSDFAEDGDFESADELELELLGEDRFDLTSGKGSVISR